MSKLLKHEKAYLKKLITHTVDKCKGRHCSVHNPSDHHMRSWDMNYRFDKRVMERICPKHGVGHPDPDDAAYWISIGKPHMTIHGCCGCCSEEKSLKDLVKQFISILDITEESDSGRSFHPTQITSCRTMDLQKIGDLIEDMRKAVND
jgi:hypothetical protein